jgi:hypothetical protein
MPGRSLSLAAAVASQLVWLPAALSQPVPVGPEFQVNAYTTGYQSNPAVAADAAGNFVVVWESTESAGADTSGGSIQGRRYDSAGVPRGEDFQVNTYTTGYQSNPAVAADAAGNFVVVWKSTESAGADTSGSSVQGRRYDSGGAAFGDEFQVNTYTTGDQDSAVVAMAEGGELRRRMGERRSRPVGLGCVSPALQNGRGAGGRRVRRQHLHDGQPVRARRGR